MLDQRNGMRHDETPGIPAVKWERNRKAYLLRQIRNHREFKRGRQTGGKVPRGPVLAQGVEYANVAKAVEATGIPHGTIYGWIRQKRPGFGWIKKSSPNENSSLCAQSRLAS